MRPAGRRAGGQKCFAAVSGGVPALRKRSLTIGRSIYNSRTMLLID